MGMETAGVSCVSDGFPHFLLNILLVPVEIHGLSVYSTG